MQRISGIDVEELSVSDGRIGSRLKSRIDDDVMGKLLIPPRIVDHKWLDVLPEEKLFNLPDYDKTRKSLQQILKNRKDIKRKIFALKDLVRLCVVRSRSEEEARGRIKQILGDGWFKEIVLNSPEFKRFLDLTVKEAGFLGWVYLRPPFIKEASCGMFKKIAVVKDRLRDIKGVIETERCKACSNAEQWNEKEKMCLLLGKKICRIENLKEDILEAMKKKKKSQITHDRQDPIVEKDYRIEVPEEPRISSDVLTGMRKSGSARRQREERALIASVEDGGVKNASKEFDKELAVFFGKDEKVRRSNFKKGSKAVRRVISSISKEAEDMDSIL